VRKTVFATGCSSWYLDDQGVPNTWPKGMTEFREAMSQPNLNDYDIKAFIPNM